VAAPRVQRADDDNPPRTSSPTGTPSSSGPSLFTSGPFSDTLLDESIVAPPRPRSQPAPTAPRPPQDLPLVQKTPTTPPDDGDRPTQTVNYTPEPNIPDQNDDGQDKVQLDLEKLARDVLPFVKRMLLIERERQPRR
jgi:hypothetical protein